MEARTLVGHVSSGGATRDYAEVIGETLTSRGHEVKIVDLKREKVDDLSPFDLVVVGMGVRMFMVYRKGKQFLSRDDLKGKRLAVFLSSAMAIEDPEKAKERFLSPLIEKHGLQPIMHDAFPGKMPVGGGKLQDRTDPEVARKWANALADEVES